jgi:hypothetical protein
MRNNVSVNFNSHQLKVSVDLFLDDFRHDFKEDEADDDGNDPFQIGKGLFVNHRLL